MDKAAWAFAVLLWVVAKSDKKLDLQEKIEIKAVLKEKYPDLETGLISKALEDEEKRIDLYSFTSVLNKRLKYSDKLAVVEDLFRVAAADNDISYEEIEDIRRIADLFYITHKDFIGAKMKIKKQKGIV